MPHENDTLKSVMCIKLLFIGKEIILKGWKKAGTGISGLLNGTVVLSPEDPFRAIYEC